jgi:hypothetical protein
MDHLIRKLHQFGFDALFFQFAENIFDQDGGIAVPSGAPIECNDLHLMILLGKLIQFTI